MEKDPIDKFFSDKLLNAETQPSDRSRELFIQKLNAPKKSTLWINRLSLKNYVGMAAALLLVGFISLFVFKNSVNDAGNISNLGKTNKETIVKSLDNTVGKAFTKTTGSSAAVTQDVKLTAKVIVVEDKNNIGKTIDNDSNLAFLEAITQIKVDDSEPEVIFKKHLENQKIEEIAYHNTLKETVISISPLDIQDYSMFLNHQAELALIEKNDALFLNELEDKTLFAKFLTEMKSLKKGEKVDFNKLGFKHIDEIGLSNEGFIASESRQLKERFNWIKSKLSNN